MNIQAPWALFPPGLTTAMGTPTQSNAGAGAPVIAPASSYIPLNCPPNGAIPPQFLPFNHVAPHPQFLAAALAAAVYGQQQQQHHHLRQQQHCILTGTPLHNPLSPNGCHKGHQVDNSHLPIGIGLPPAKRKYSAAEIADSIISREIKKAKLETKALKAKRPGFTDERYNETSYYYENGLRKVYPYYFTFTTFTKGRWVGEKILDVFAREFRAHPVEEYERCIKSGTLTVNYTKVETDYRLKHNDLLANIVHRHEVPVTSEQIEIVHMDDDIVVVNKPASIPVHPCGRYRHNTVVFILAKEFQMKNLRTIHRLDRLTSGLLLFGRTPKKAREMEHQIRNRVVSKEYVCRVDGDFPGEEIECEEPIEVVSYKIGVCKVSPAGKQCRTTFKKLSSNGKTSVVMAKPLTGRMHQIRVHLQYLGYPISNDPLYNHPVFGPERGKGGNIGKTDEQLIKELISIHNAENWLGIDDAVGGESDGFGLSAAAATAKPSSSQDEVECLEIQTPPDTPTTSSTSSSHHHHDGAELEVSKATPSQPQTPVVVELLDSVQNVPVEVAGKVTVGTQTYSNMDEEEATEESKTSPEEFDSKPNQHSELTAFNMNSMTYDPHCYECKVRYRDPKPKDLVMYLHAIRYGGPEWGFETKLPPWAAEDWEEPPDC